MQSGKSKRLGLGPEHSYLTICQLLKIPGPQLLISQMGPDSLCLSRLSEDFIGTLTLSEVHLVPYALLCEGKRDLSEGSVEPTSLKVFFSDKETQAAYRRGRRRP